MYRERIYFSPGDVVRLKHKIDNRPTMMVQSVDKIDMKKEGESAKLLGVTCIWFDTTKVMHTHRFSTKDLEKVNLNK